MSADFGWECPQCTLINPWGRERCDVCDYQVSVPPAWDINRGPSIGSSTIVVTDSPPRTLRLSADENVRGCVKRITSKPAVEVLRKIITNVLAHPEEPKYRGPLNKSSAKLKTALLEEADGVPDILKLAGFEESDEVFVMLLNPDLHRLAVLEAALKEQEDEIAARQQANLAARAAATVAEASRVLPPPVKRRRPRFDEDLLREVHAEAKLRCPGAGAASQLQAGSSTSASSSSRGPTEPHNPGGLVGARGPEEILVIGDDTAVDAEGRKKQEAAEACSGLRGRLRLRIRLPVGGSLEMEADGSSSVDSFRQTLHQRFGIPPGQQRLLFGFPRRAYQGKGDCTLREAGLSDGTVLHLESTRDVFLGALGSRQHTMRELLGKLPPEDVEDSNDVESTGKLFREVLEALSIDWKETKFWDVVRRRLRALPTCTKFEADQIQSGLRSIRKLFNSHDPRERVALALEIVTSGPSVAREDAPARASLPLPREIGGFASMGMGQMDDDDDEDEEEVHEHDPFGQEEQEEAEEEEEEEDDDDDEDLLHRLQEPHGGVRGFFSDLFRQRPPAPPRPPPPAARFGGVAGGFARNFGLDFPGRAGGRAQVGGGFRMPLGLGGHAHLLGQLGQGRRGNGHGHGVILEVDRSNLLHSVALQVLSMNRAELHGPLCVRFSNEAGQDAGGLTRDFFSSFGRSLAASGQGQDLNGQEMLWELTGRGSLQPVPRAVVDLHDERVRKSRKSGSGLQSVEIYRACGRVYGLAVLHGCKLGQPLSRPFLRLLIGDKVEDLASLQAELRHEASSTEPDFRGRPELLQQSLQEWGFEAGDLTFSWSVRNRPELPPVDLVKGGAGIPVTDENKVQWLTKLLKRELVKEPAPAAQAFRTGLIDVLGGGHGTCPLLCLLGADDLQELWGHAGVSKQEVARWRAIADVSPGATQQAAWFWEVLEHDYDDDLRGKVLQFSTGSSAVGRDGLKQFNISPAEGGDERLPTAMTCGNLLQLPRYSCRAILAERLRTAAEGCSSFQMA